MNTAYRAGYNAGIKRAFQDLADGVPMLATDMVFAYIDSYYGTLTSNRTNARKAGFRHGYAETVTSAGYVVSYGPDETPLSGAVVRESG